jgi:hypothetical protein
MPLLTVRPGHLRRVVPSCPAWPPGLRPLFLRSDRGAGLASPSLDGGLEEFREFCFSRLKLSDPLSCRSSSARACASSWRIDATSPASTSYGGGGP